MSIRGRNTGIAGELSARLRHRITIEQPNDTADGGGGVTRGWTTVATVWAEIIPTRGGAEQGLGEAAIQALHTHRITIRYRDDVSTDMRIGFDGRYFNIRSITNVEEAKVVLELNVEEGGAV
ncbi:MAG: phage head closure protein [Rickettsiales bacterium]|nr:phage head closure protein [Rickettsiales bacterium]